MRRSFWSIFLVINMLEGWHIREPICKRIKTVYWISKNLNVGQSSVLKSLLIFQRPYVLQKRVWTLSMPKDVIFYGHPVIILVHTNYQPPSEDKIIIIKWSLRPTPLTWLRNMYTIPYKNIHIHVFALCLPEWEIDTFNWVELDTACSVNFLPSTVPAPTQAKLRWNSLFINVILNHPPTRSTTHSFPD